jgi:hypothetical protein
VPSQSKQIFALTGTEIPVPALVLTVIAVLAVLDMKYSFVLLGTIRFAPPEPVNTMYIFLAVQDAPWVIGSVTSVPFMACDV